MQNTLYAAGRINICSKALENKPESSMTKSSSG
jgi:hypothetical protein